MENKIDFLEEESGVKSSTRKKSWYLLWFFFFFNTILLGYIGMIKYNNPADSILDLSTFALTSNMILLTGAFTPQYLHKRQEVTKYLESMKENKSKP